MPRLAFREVTCNCTKFPHVATVIITTQKEDTITKLKENCDLDSNICSESFAEFEGEEEEENGVESACEKIKEPILGAKRKVMI